MEADESQGKSTSAGAIITMSGAHTRACYLQQFYVWERVNLTKFNISF